jgi:hypothetical protein
MSAPRGARVTERLRPDELGLLALRVVALVAVVVGVPHVPNAAAQRFVEIAHAPGLPWRDTPVEYAFGDWIVIRAVGFGGVGLARALFGLVAFGSDLVAWRAVAAGWGRAAAGALSARAPLLAFIYRRSDLVAVALRRRPALAARGASGGRRSLAAGASSRSGRSWWRPRSRSSATCAPPHGRIALVAGVRAVAARRRGCSARSAPSAARPVGSSSRPSASWWGADRRASVRGRREPTGTVPPVRDPRCWPRRCSPSS